MSREKPPTPRCQACHDRSARVWSALPGESPRVFCSQRCSDACWAKVLSETLGGRSPPGAMEAAAMPPAPAGGASAAAAAAAAPIGFQLTGEIAKKATPLTPGDEAVVRRALPVSLRDAAVRFYRVPHPVRGAAKRPVGTGSGAIYLVADASGDLGRAVTALTLKNNAEIYVGKALANKARRDLGTRAVTRTVEHTASDGRAYAVLDLANRGEVAERFASLNARYAALRRRMISRGSSLATAAPPSAMPESLSFSERAPNACYLGRTRSTWQAPIELVARSTRDAAFAHVLPLAGLFLVALHEIAHKMTPVEWKQSQVFGTKRRVRVVHGPAFYASLGTLLSAAVAEGFLVPHYGTLSARELNKLSKRTHDLSWIANNDAGDLLAEEDAGGAPSRERGGECTEDEDEPGKEGEDGSDAEEEDAAEEAEEEEKEEKETPLDGSAVGDRPRTHEAPPTSQPPLSEPAPRVTPPPPATSPAPPRPPSVHTNPPIDPFPRTIDAIPGMSGGAMRRALGSSSATSYDLMDKRTDLGAAAFATWYREAVASHASLAGTAPDALAKFERWYADSVAKLASWRSADPARRPAPDRSRASGHLQDVPGLNPKRDLARLLGVPDERALVVLYRERYHGDRSVMRAFLSRSLGLQPEKKQSDARDLDSTLDYLDRAPAPVSA